MKNGKMKFILPVFISPEAGPYGSSKIENRKSCSCFWLAGCFLVAKIKLSRLAVSTKTEMKIRMAAPQNVWSLNFWFYTMAVSAASNAKKNSRLQISRRGTREYNIIHMLSRFWCLRLVPYFNWKVFGRKRYRWLTSWSRPTSERESIPVLLPTLREWRDALKKNEFVFCRQLSSWSTRIQPGDNKHTVQEQHPTEHQSGGDVCCC